MTAELAGLANALVSVAYVAITLAILVPLARAGQVWSNRLGTATAAIFFSCAVGHGFHAVNALQAGGHMSLHWYEAAWDLLTAGVAVHYWTLRRTYGQLMQGATLFEDLEQRRRLTELEHEQALASVRAKAERERDAYAAMLKGVVANSQSLVYVKDLEGRFLLANHAVEEAFGVDEQELLGRTDDLLDDEGAVSAWQANDRLAREGKIVVEEEAVLADGRHVYQSVKFPLHDADGQVYATCGISLDVTAQRLAAQETARARDVALATAAAKSAFLATMSHEIRTPMNAVIGMTGLLLDTDLDELQRDFVETVRSSGDALLVIINDILDFSKIEAGELHLEQQDFDLRTCAEGAMDLVAQAAAAKSLDLVLDIGAGVPERLVGDASRLRQVLVNLLGNAVKFTDTGEVVLEVRADPVAAGDPRVVLTVRDTGIGIPADHLPRLFQSFTQVDASTTRVYGGTGLGLAISRRLVEAMGGELGVESTFGVGSAFTARVPLASAPSVAPPRGASVLPGRSVLVVDDGATSRRALETQLTGWGLDVTAVATPREALAAVGAGHAYDVALLDAHLPDMTGEQLARALGRLPTGRDLPVVLLTKVGERPQGDGVVGHVSRPPRAAALRAVLTRAVEGTPAAQTGRPVAPEPGTRRLRVLVAEDNLVNQRVARLMLGALGHAVDAVGSGQEAVTALRRAPYDVVLMDVHMPQMDGLAATRAIRAQLPQDRQPRILALTASVLADDREACLAAGMDGYLTKPVRQEQLGLALAAGPGAAPAVPGLVRSSEGALDVSVVDALVGSLDGPGSDLRDELLGSYLDDAGERMSELVRVGRTGDVAGARRIAHALRSSSEALGVRRLAERLLRLEQAADGADLDRLVREAVQEHEAAVEEIGRLLPVARDGAALGRLGVGGA